MKNEHADQLNVKTETNLDANVALELWWNFDYRYFSYDRIDRYR